jgi:hypothetical protein
LVYKVAEFLPGSAAHPFCRARQCVRYLAVAARILLTRSGKSEIAWIASEPQNLEELRTFLCELFSPLGVAPHEVACFVSRLLVLGHQFPGAAVGRVRKPKVVGIHLVADLFGTGTDAQAGGDARPATSTRTVGYTLLQLLYG